MALHQSRLESELADYLSDAVVVTAYAQDGQADSLRETRYLTVAEEGQGLAHLSFAVDAVSTRYDADRRVEVAVVQVEYLYHLRAATQRADRRLAADLARDIVDAILRAEIRGAVMIPETVWRSAVDRVGEWLLVTLTLSAAYDREER